MFCYFVLLRAKRSMQVSLFDVMQKKKKKGNIPSTEELLTGEDLEEDLCQEVENSSTSGSSTL